MIAAPLVFVPALGSDARLWQPVADRLADRFDTVVVRGEGNSIREMADSVLDQSPEKFYLAGNSMGGYVALDIAFRAQRSRVLGLALLNSSAIAADAGRRENSLRVIEMARRGQFDEAVTLITSAVAPGRPDIAAAAAAMARDLGADVFVAQQIAVMTRSDRRAELDSLAVPTLVIAGEEDAITPSALGGELADSVPGAEFDVLAGVGHLSTLEAPDAVADRIGSWLTAITADRTESLEVRP
ncbi:alpha/beta fold hydrolase [Rhodococcus fascians]|nr:alpha/beta fold hydrolase [Rhodococcus fascians]MBY4114619.1 alpha/beta fold hydrolase [Rhodococcus fascians]